VAKEIMTSQQKRRLTLAINGYGRARMAVGRNEGAGNLGKFVAQAVRREAHLVAVVADLVATARPRANDRRCTCPAWVDITFSGHVAGCPAGGWD
jgi:hypothetical protein